MRKIVTVLCLTVAGLGGAAPALAHQHLSAPSGDCAAGNSNVPQGNPENPGGNIPGNLNNAAGNEQGSEHCQRSTDGT